MALFPSHTVAPGQDAFGYLSPDDLGQLRILARDKFVFARYPLPTVYRRLVEWKLARIIAVYDKPPYNGANFPYVDLKITEKGRRVYAAVQAWEVDDATRRQTRLFNPAASGEETMRLVWHKLTRGASANEPFRLWLLGTPTPVIDAIRRAVSPSQEHRHGARSDGPTPPDWDRIGAAFEALVVAFQATQAARLSGIESRRRAAVLATAKAAYIESFPVAPMAAGFTLSMIDRDLGFRPDWVSWPQEAATTGTEFMLVRAGIARMTTRGATAPLRATPIARLEAQ